MQKKKQPQLKFVYNRDRNQMSQIVNESTVTVHAL